MVNLTRMLVGAGATILGISFLEAMLRTNGYNPGPIGHTLAGAGEFMAGAITSGINYVVHDTTNPYTTEAVLALGLIPSGAYQTIKGFTQSRR